MNEKKIPFEELREIITLVKTLDTFSQFKFWRLIRRYLELEEYKEKKKEILMRLLK